MKGKMVLAAFLGVLVGVVLLGSVGNVDAATVRGTPIQIQNLDDAGATVNDQMSLGMGRVAAMTVGFLGGLTFIFGYVAPGLLAAGGGFGSALLPGAISGTFDAAPAADGVLAPLTPYLQVISGFLGDRLLYDPVMYLALGLALALLVVSRRQQVQVAA